MEPIVFLLAMIIMVSCSSNEESLNLNPDNILSTSVLEGNKAIELYGQSAKNGVIIITTKNVILCRIIWIIKSI